MFPRLLALKLFAAILLTGCRALDGGVQSPTPADLPNDCAIVATEAFARLKPCGFWVRLLSIRGLRFDQRIVPFYHMVIVWQVDEGANVFVYDRNGTAELPTRGRSLQEIVKAFNKLAIENDVLITEARFLSP